MKKTSILFILLSLCLTASTLIARTTLAAPSPTGSLNTDTNSSLLPNKNPAVTARLIANTKAIIPGQPFKLGIELTMKPGWHTYYKDPGDAGMPTKIVWQLPTGFENNSLYWVKPTKFNEGGIITYGYTNKTLIATEVTAPLNDGILRSFNFSAQVKWLSCKDICVPGQATVNLTLPVISQTNPHLLNLAVNTKEFANASIRDTGVLNQNLENQNKSNTSFITYFAFAFIGGFLLNFMPCVLPVVAIKLLGLLEKADKNSTRKTAIAFASGIFSSFLLLALFIIALQATGHKVGWGFQFQQPVFLMIMSIMVLLFGLSLFGLFDLSFNLGQKTVDALAAKEGFVGDFFKGVLATILSTPCTAPFLGTALGFAFVAPWTTTLTIFAAVGIGMSLPYLILIIAPQYLRFLPKPGAWMAKLKEAFGFVLLATVIWLLSILYYQVPIALVIAFTYFLLSVSFAAWLLSRFTDLTSSSKCRLIVSSLALLIVLSAGYYFIYENKNLLAQSTIRNTTNSKTSGVPSDRIGSFDIETLNNALNSQKTVFLDFTAKWCLTCQLNENAVINTNEVQNKLRSLNVLFLKADWTRQDPTVTKLLRQFERSGVPLYVIFPGKSPDKPIVLPELITKEIVLSKLDEAGPSLNKN